MEDFFLATIAMVYTWTHNLSRGKDCKYKMMAVLNPLQIVCFVS